MNQQSEIPSDNNGSYDYQNLLDIIRQKDSINMALVDLTKKQQYQIDQLLISAEEKNQQHIRKVKYTSYAPYLIKNKYLVVKLLQCGSEIFLPQDVQLCNFQDINFATTTPLYKDSSSKAVFLELETLKKEIGKIVADSPQQIKIVQPVEIAQFKGVDNIENNSEKSKEFFYNYEARRENFKPPSFSDSKFINNNDQQQRLKKLQQKLLISQQKFQQNGKKPQKYKQFDKKEKMKPDQSSKQVRDALRNKYKVVYIRN